MKIAIISAMLKEIMPLINKINVVEEFQKEGYTFKKGFLNDNEIIITSGGIGKVNTGVITTILYMLFPDIDLLINVGISGGVIGNVNKGDIVISDKLSYIDVDTSQFGEAFGQVPDLPLYYTACENVISKVSKYGKCGLILTGDKFISDKNLLHSIIDKHFSSEKVMCVDMESTAFAQVCYLFKIPFISIRCISDLIGGENQTDLYEDYNKIACEKACKVLELLITNNF